MEALNYKDLIKKVHPDLNPNVADAGVKISQIMANKNNPSELMRLAIHWGLIRGESTYQKPKEKSFSWVKFCAFNKKQFKSGMKVKFNSEKGEHIAWFIKSGRGRVFFTDKKGVFTINKSLNDLFYKFDICRERDNDLSYSEVLEWSEIVKNLGKKSTTKTTTESNHKKMFDDLDIEPNRSYYGDRYMKYKGSYYKLWKTNDKCAFIVINGDAKKVQLKSLSKGWRI